MSNQQNSDIHFGISAKMSLAIGVVIIVISALSFWVATSLNKILTIATVMDKNMVIADNIVEEIGEEDMASLLERGKKIYDSLSEKQLANPTGKAYQSQYDALLSSEYKAIKRKLIRSADVPEVMWADLCFKDSGKERYIYLMHTGAKDNGTFGVGYWENDDTRINSSVVAPNKNETLLQMENLPEWFGDLSDILPESFQYVPHVIDRLWGVESLDISNRFSILYPIIFGDTGETIGYLGIGEYYENYQTYSWAFALAFAATVIPYFIIITLIASVFVKRTIVSPIQQLARAAVEYGEDEDKQRDGQHFKKVQIRSHDEVLLLRDAMSDMENSLIKYMDNLQQMTAKQERFKTEMDMSAQIQMGMLPKTLEDNGKERDFSISATIKPAKAVGGDFYDFFEIDDDRIGIVIADVSGKGMPAALFMMIAKLILGSIAKGSSSVVDIMRRTNQKLCDNNPETLFVTIWFGIYYVKDRTIRYVNAGHDYPALYRESEGRFSLVEEENSFVAGFDPTTDFSEHVITLQSKDKFFLYTDGIPEAHNPAEEMLGTDRMVEVLNRNKNQTKAAFLEAVDADVRGFIGEADQFDDMTMLLLEVK